MAYKGNELLHIQSIKEFLGEEKIKSFVNFVLQSFFIKWDTLF